MIWMNHTGSIQPVGSNSGSTVSIAGHTWNVWTGNNGANNVVSYVGNPAGITSLSFNVMSFITDTLSRGSQYGSTSWYLSSIQDGFEPWVGGVGLAVSNFSAAVSTSGGGATPTPTAVRTASPTPVTSATPTPVRSATPTPTAVRSASATPIGTGIPSARCSATFAYASQWSNGFTANITVSNPGGATTKTWKVTWTWGGNQSLVNSWSATVTQSGTAVTANSLSYNGTIAAGGNTSFGFQAGFSGTITAPTLTCSAT
jgi:cellulose 1,4-beta-cellobiosidase